MLPNHQEERKSPRRGGLRTRFLIFFLIPVLLVGLGCILLIEFIISGPGLSGDLPASAIRVIYAALVLIALLLAAGLALYVGERITHPIAWLLRAMESGQVRMLSRAAAAAADWEMGVLARRVQVLLQQNLSGAEAMEQLDALRDEIAAVLDAAASGELVPASWPRERATHRLTGRLLDFFRIRDESAADARGSLRKLQGLLEQDWRDETRGVEEIVARTERCFLEQTQVAMELEQLERALGTEGGTPSEAPRAAVAGNEAASMIADLRLGFERWVKEVSGAFPAEPGAAAGRTLTGRLQAWTEWVEESLGLLEGFVQRGADEEPLPSARVGARLKKIRTMAAEASQQMGALSREAAQLQHTWRRLGERLRSLMARVGEVEGGLSGTEAPEQGGSNGDTQPGDTDPGADQ